MGYADLSEHQWMIEDRIRTSAYERAIGRVVRPGDRVLDFGCGLGILSCFAARAGASRVYAADRLPIVRLAQSVFRKNGLKQIAAIFAPDGPPDLPEPVDVIVSEWMGAFALHEGMLAPLLQARDYHLVPGGRMVPNRVELFAALVTGTRVHEQRSYFRTKPYGIDFSPVADLAMSELKMVALRPDELAKPYARVADIDLCACREAPKEVKGMLTLGARATVFGIVGWFDAHLGGDVVLRTGPYDPTTHWEQFYFPFSEPWDVTPDRPVTMRFWPVLVETGYTRWRWWASDGRESREGENVTSLAWLTRPLPPGIVT